MHYLLPHLLTRAAAQSPDQIAIVAGSDSVSYRDLDQSSDRVAAVLKKEFGADLDDADILPENFHNVRTIAAMVKRAKP